MKVSDEQERDSAIHTYVGYVDGFLPQTSLPTRLPHNVEQSSMCWTVGPCWVSVLNIAVWTYFKTTARSLLLEYIAHPRSESQPVTWSNFFHSSKPPGSWFVTWHLLEHPPEGLRGGMTQHV